MKERTLSIIKPDATERNLIGAIAQMIEGAGLKIVAMKMLHLTKKEAEGFYAVHKEKPFFGELTDYMCSGPVVVSVLEGENAIKRYREIMGATNPDNALAGTLRADYADSFTANAVHGSDAVESAQREIAYFFNESEICPR